MSHLNCHITKPYRLSLACGGFVITSLHGLEYFMTVLFVQQPAQLLHIQFGITRRQDHITDVSKCNFGGVSVNVG